ncbi:DUF488 domain-containing protein [Corynebacterium massiliense]|uniref:MarR family transcriptional regulator n=1 Tax=Corynebacterium massiliense DSM 45435 TaxID=1121364 RepID=A0ABY7U8L9_9CORY|nr:hypothetical protein CMASS_02970 [Corynebacterium massiliense DSM 45435]
MSEVQTAKVHDVVKDPGLLPDGSTAVLVDRMWPRGVAKDDVPYDEWFKDVAPSPELRKWWNHRAEDFDEFAERYRNELSSNDSEELERLTELVESSSGSGPVVLLFAAKDREVNHATVLAQWLRA